VTYPCHDPKDGRTLSHAASGWLTSPDGRPIVTMCHEHAQNCIDEYREKLGESWTFNEEGDR
jgi:hypothetical protein